jgi:hypothetical protein
MAELDGLARRAASDLAEAVRPVPLPRLPQGHAPARGGRQRIAVACVALAGAVAAGVAVATLSRGSSGSTQVVAGPAVRQVASALESTEATGRFDMSYRVSFTPAAGGAPPVGPIAGSGTVNLRPYAMVAHADVPGLGVITTVMDGSRIWEFGGYNYGVPPGGPGPGAAISGFTPLVVATLGPQEGAVDMLGLASATGYLDLAKAAIRSAEPTGMGTVDGNPVTIYRVGVDPSKLPSEPGITAGEAAALRQALGVLERSDFRAMTDTIAVDHQGLIRQLTETVVFRDGATVVQTVSISNFGTAPTVQLPGGAGRPASSDQYAP